MVAQSVLAPAPAVDLHALGLTDDDRPEIDRLASQINSADHNSITDFGQEVAIHVADSTKSLVGRVGAKDLDVVGDKLNAVIRVAQKIHGKGSPVARVPVVGRLLERGLQLKERLMTNVRSAGNQIEVMLNEVAGVRDVLAGQIVEMDEMYAAVHEEARLLGLHVAALRQRTAEIGLAISDLETSETLSPDDTQRLADLRQAQHRLEKRSADLLVLQQSAFQTLPAIRIIQGNNAQLMEKYDTIRAVTVPAWQRQIALAVALEEQRDAVQLAKTIDDTTNAMLRRNADLLRQNAVGSAQSNQRLVIDVETLDYVQKQIVGTCQDVLRIQKEGRDARAKAEHQLMGMRGELGRLLAGKPQTEEAANV